MVTYDLVAASYSHRAVFLADGRATDHVPNSRRRDRPHASDQQLTVRTEPIGHSMFKLTIKHLLANKVRFAYHAGRHTAVSFVVSGFRARRRPPQHLHQGLGRSDRRRRPRGPQHRRLRGPTAATAGHVETVAGVDGVADAVASIETGYNPRAARQPNGSHDPHDGPPQLSFNWIDNPQLNAFTMVDGTPPQPGEFTMDFAAAAKYGFGSATPTNS